MREVKRRRKEDQTKNAMEVGSWGNKALMIQQKTWQETVAKDALFAQWGWDSNYMTRAIF